jgi:hypothetical protein
LVASATFPAGIDLTQFADDGDSLDIPQQQIADKAMGVNGDLVVWSRANPLTLTINLIPGSDDDRNMSVLLEANRVARGKRGARDTITLTAVYPDETTQTWSLGRITDGIPGKALASSGRMKSKPYMFAFENLARS